MAGPEFWQTSDGRVFFSQIVPSIAQSLKRLADVAERIEALMYPEGGD